MCCDEFCPEETCCAELLLKPALDDASDSAVLLLECGGVVLATQALRVSGTASEIIVRFIIIRISYSLANISG